MSYVQVTVLFTPEEQAAFLARTDLVEGETILSPYESFVMNHLGEWNSLGLVNPDEWEGDPEDDDSQMPIAASGYEMELLDANYAAIFELHAPAIRRLYNAEQAFKAAWPYRVALPANDGRYPGELESALVDVMWFDEIAWAQANSKGAVAHPFLTELYEDQIIFGFERQKDAALFKLFWSEGE